MSESKEPATLETSAETTGKKLAGKLTPPKIVQLGRRQVFALAVSLVGSIVLWGALAGAPLPFVLMHVVALGLLSFQLFRGRIWARWALVVLCGFVSIANAVGAVQMLVDDSPWAFNLGYAVIYGWCTGVLLYSKPIRAHMAYFRANEEPGVLEP